MTWTTKNCRSCSCFREILVVSGSAQESISFFATACDILKKHAGNEIEYVLVQTLDYLGQAHEDVGDFSTSVEAYKQSVEIATRYLKLSPINSSTVLDLERTGYTSFHLESLLFSNMSFEESLWAFGQAKKLLNLAKIYYRNNMHPKISRGATCISGWISSA